MQHSSVCLSLQLVMWQFVSSMDHLCCRFISTLCMFLFLKSCCCWLCVVTSTRTLSRWCHQFDLSGPAKAQRRSGKGYPDPERVLCLWKPKLGAGPGTASVGKRHVASLQSNRQSPAIQVSGMTPIHFWCISGFLNERLFISMFVI